MKKQLYIFLLLTLFSFGTKAQTVVVMKVASQPQEAFQAESILDSPLPIDIKVNFGSIAFDVWGGTDPYQYAWYENEELLGTGENIEFTPLAGKTYKLEVNDDNNCKISIPIETSTSTGIKDLTVQFSVQPSIVDNYIEVTCENHKTLIEIFDLGGLKKHSESIYGDSRIDLDLKPGIYLVKLSTKGEYYITKIIVK